MSILYTTDLKKEVDINILYENLGWMNLVNNEPQQLYQAMKQSWYVIYVYEGDVLIGTGRIISDGITFAYICGIGVATGHRNKCIGKEICLQLINRCKKNNPPIQLYCESNCIPYYETQGFVELTVGMKENSILG